MAEPIGAFPTLDDLRAAAARIAPHARRTPVMTCITLDAMAGADLFFKCENFQKVGAFKFRGACNAVFSLTEAEAARGVVTHSSGNHAQALALAARMRGIPAYIVMPRTTPAIKQAAVEGYGGRVTLCEPNQAAREAAAQLIIDETGAALVHPYNDYRVIAGQATAAMELFEQVPNLDAIIAPVGGGGLLSGTALATRYVSPNTLVFAGEPEGADDAFRSVRDGMIYPSVEPKTIADGLLTALGDKTFPIVREHLKQILLVDDDAIRAAMRLIFERMKIVVEPSSAVPLAAVLANADTFAGQRVGLILSGGNVDLAAMKW